ncbi:hypothetical protein Pan241w_37370 [Gimesia alba]|uniref:Uncharacterized protein n=1 Tax=Gimesia alba TaxID=2527973 RepID=A0A517RIC1_9PLAN|nr:hypothetical protein Pan241w_37370 [Gimesia alba]
MILSKSIRISAYDQLSYYELAFLSKLTVRLRQELELD